MNSNDITTQYLDKIYEDLQKEQFRLLTDMKNSSDDKKDVTKQITIINNISVNVIRLRNIRKKPID